MKLGDLVESRMQDTLMIGILMLSFAWLILVGAILPEYASVVGPVGYFVIIFGGLFGTEIAIREYVNSYPYLRILVRPENDWLHAFLSPGGSKRIGPNKYTTTLNLRFPVKLEEYGAVKRIELHHEGKWSERVKFSRGMCVWSGFSVPHPQTEIIEVFQVPKASAMMDHGEPVPVFVLKGASMDFYYGRPSSAAPEAYAVKVDRERLDTLTAQMAEAERQKSEWHTRAISAEEVIDQQKAEIKGLLEAKAGVKDRAYEYMLTIYQLVGSIEESLTQMKGTTWNKALVKYIAMTVLGLSVVGLIWANPEILTVLASNVLVVLAVIVVAGAIIVYATRRKGRTIPL